ncbi:MAG: Entericidin EcnA/B family [Pseudomonadota bacterium]|jgi:predicted small secreted protein
MKALFITMAAVLSLSQLAACNTVKGIGQDIQTAGQKIEDATKKTK